MIKTVFEIEALASGTSSINVTAPSPITFPTPDQFPAAIVTGTKTLTGAYNISPTGTPSKFSYVEVFWEADVTPTTHSVFIFGKEVPSEMLDDEFKAECLYNGSDWMVRIGPDMAGNKIIGGDRIATDSIETDRLKDNIVTMSKMAGLTKGSLIYGNATGDPAELVVAVNGRMILGDTTNGLAAVDMSGDGSLTKAGALTIAAGAITASKASGNILKYTRDITLSFQQASEVGNINLTICEDCTIDEINVTVLDPAVTDTATLIYKDNGGTVLAGSQTDVTTGLTLGNVVSTTPTANNIFAARDNLLIEMSKTTKTSCKVNVSLCITKT